MGLFIWIGVTYRLLNQPENYWGFNIMWAQTLFLVNLAIAWTTKPVSNIAIIFNLTSITLINFIFYFNVLVPYEIWLDRSMPTRFEFSSPF